MIKQFLVTLGELRSLLVGGSAVCIFASAFTTNDEVRMQGWGMFPDVLAPVLSIILVFVIMLDVLMSRIYMSEQADDIKQRYRIIIRTELLSVLLMFVVWAPYLVRILG
ncbi:MAG: hypothetical protein PVF52_03725 [Granulosicoccaceae bacterium]|jgi:hypothetical protein